MKEWRRQQLLLGLDVLHRQIRRLLPRTDICSDCKSAPAVELANISPVYNVETYNKDLKNWRWVCRRCHTHSDGRVEKLALISRTKTVPKMDMSQRRCAECGSSKTSNRHWFKVADGLRKCSNCYNRARYHRYGRKRIR